MTGFRVGDKVRAPTIDRVVGEITNVRSAHGVEKLLVDFDERLQVFLADGRYYHDAEEPALFLVERPKRKVKVERWVEIHRVPTDDRKYYGEFMCVTQTSEKDSLNSVKGSSYIKTVKFETEVEIEE